MEAGRSVVDDRKSLINNVVRGEMLLAGFLVMEKEGSDGKVSVVCEMNRFNPMFSVLFVNKKVAKWFVASYGGRLLEMKRDVEKLLEEYVEAKHTSGNSNSKSNEESIGAAKKQ